MSELILKACPFCNGEASLSEGQIDTDSAYYVECLDCAASSEMKFYIEEAQEAWNKRAEVK